MVAFLKHQMHAELQSVFLCMAETLRVGASPEMAKMMIGFSVKDGVSYNLVRTSLVDLSRFEITPYFDYAYDFAFKAEIRKGMDFSFLDKIHDFLAHIPRSLIEQEMSWRHHFMLQEGYCQSVATASQARRNLEFEEGYLFSVTEIALLANVSESEVRGAVADKTKNGLRAKTKSNHVSINHLDAKRWLAGQRHFRSALPCTGSRS